MKKQIILAALSALLLLGQGIAGAADEKFAINRFNVQGNTVLSKTEIDQVIAPFTGKDKVYGDVEKALEALERAYHSKGYGTVSAYVPCPTRSVTRPSLSQGHDHHARWQRRRGL